jgi:hypothetical protein
VGVARRDHTGPVAMALTVSLSSPSSLSVTVDYAFADVTASASTDYTTPSGTYTGTLVIPPGVTSQ